MAKFNELLDSLSRGESIRRDEWGEAIRMFVMTDTLMCQCGMSTPWRYALSWDEIVATDWVLMDQAFGGKYIVNITSPLRQPAERCSVALPELPAKERANASSLLILVLDVMRGLWSRGGSHGLSPRKLNIEMDMPSAAYTSDKRGEVLFRSSPKK